MRQGIRFFASLALVGALVAGGFSHAVVPHDEGDHHSGKEIVWGTLHAALGHEQKYFLAFVSIAFMLLGSAIVAQLPGRSMVLQVLAADRKHMQLRRGIVAYRRFG